MDMSYSLLEHLMLRRESVHLIDIRSQAEFKAIHIPGAHCVPFAELAATRIFQKLRAMRQPICVISANGGARASLATGILRSVGCENVVPLEGGMKNWIARGLPVARKRFSPKARASFARATLATLAAGEAFALHDWKLASLLLAIAAFLLLGAKTLGRSRGGQTNPLYDHEMNDDLRQNEPSFAGGVTT